MERREGEGKMDILEWLTCGISRWRAQSSFSAVLLPELLVEHVQPSVVPVVIACREQLAPIKNGTTSMNHSEPQ